MTTGTARDTFADALERERERLFVGRDVELRRLEGLVDGSSPTRVCALTGPGGVGKTELVGAFARRMARRGVPILWIDGGAAAASESSFAQALGASSGASPAGDAPVTLLVVIDRFELVGSLERWFRERWLPGVATSVRVVLSGRAPLGPEWSRDAGWSRLVDHFELGELAPDAVFDYLGRRAVPEARRAEVLRVTRGHPLALALFADVAARAPERPIALRESPDVVQRLLDSLLDGVPDEAHRQALWSMALVRHTTEELLAAMVPPLGGASATAQAKGLFDTLRSLSFVRARPAGLEPHDLIRELLAADLSWRFPELRLHLLARAAGHYRRTLALYPQRGPALFVDIAFLWRVEVPSAGYPTHGLHTSTPRRGDEPELEAMISATHGPTALAIYRHWVAAGCERVVVRDADDRLQAHALYLELDRLGDEALAVDPGAVALRAELARRGAIEGAIFQRYIVDRDTGEAPAPSMLAISRWEFERFVQSRVASDGFGAWKDPANGMDILPPNMAERLPGADFTLDGHRYHIVGTTAHGGDPLTWFLDGLFEPLVARTETPAPALERSEFDRALRAALKDFHRVERLAANVLLRARVFPALGDGRGAIDTADALRALLRHACSELGAGDELDREVIERTYFRRRVKQVGVAVDLNLPFSSYRRRLGLATTRLADWLWVWAQRAIAE